MKILHIINALDKGGAEKLLSELLPLLNNEIDVSLLALTSFDNVYDKNLKDNGIKVEYVTHKQNFKNLSVFLKLRKLLKNNTFDLIHVHLFPSQYFVPFACQNQLVFTEHSTHSKRRQKVFIKLEKYIASKYKKYIFVSQEAKKSFEEFIGMKNSSHNQVIYNGINLPRLDKKTDTSLKDEFKLKDTDKVITMISSFKDEKDHKTIIDAMKDKSNWHLFLLGEGYLLDKFKEYVKSVNLTENIHFLGFVSNPGKIIMQSDLIVQSSFKEGFGLAVLEAMAYEKPVLVSDIDGLKEVVDTPDFRFTVGDISNLTKKIERLFLNKIEYEKSVHYSTSQARKFTIQQTATNYLNLYKEINYYKSREKEIK